MKEEREAFSHRLKQAMRDADYAPRPGVLHKVFNSRYAGRSVSFTTVSRWLRGKAIPQQDKLQLLADLLEIEPQVLRFGGSVSKVGEPKRTKPESLKPQDRGAIDAYLALPASRRKLVRELIAQLADSAQRHR
ncbi:MAG TPA: helix-turn-helix domain-containing protein [Rhodanobacteraceae bacterium]